MDTVFLENLRDALAQGSLEGKSWILGGSLQESVSPGYRSGPSPYGLNVAAPLRVCLWRYS